MANSLSAAEANSKYKEPGAQPAGFLAGLWHGITAPITFIVSLFATGVSIYETTNNGRWLKSRAVHHFPSLNSERRSRELFGPSWVLTIFCSSFSLPIRVLGANA